jgi:homeobox protein HoxA/B2
MDGCLTSAETGFINSQPSMAEFMTALPHLTGELQHPPPPGSLSPPPGTYQGLVDSHGQPPPGQQPPPPGVNVPEYPWMKEKKTTRKSNQQGKMKHYRSSSDYETQTEFQRLISRKLNTNLKCMYVI